jgi:hypothetical protein
MQQKRLTAAVLCALYAVLVFGAYCFVIADGFASLALNGSLDGFTPPRAFESPLYRISAIAGAVLIVFVVLDAIAVLNEQEEWFGDPPSAYPLAYAAMRLRRYALIPLGLGYALLLLSWLGPTKVLGTTIGTSRDNMTIFAGVLLAVLFSISRRPINWAPTHVFQTVLDFLGGVAKGLKG